MTVPTTIVFDLDGTLIDTAPDLVGALNEIFAREGLAHMPYEAARNLIGGGIKAMIARGLEAEGRVFPPAKLEQMFADFIAHYSEHLADRSRPFLGLTDALDILAARGCRLAVCTNKLERLSLLLLINSSSLIGLLRSVGKTPSEFRNLTRKSSGAPWRPQVGTCNGQS